MTTTTEAIWTGVRRGVQMGIRPDAARLRELRAAASSTDYTAEAWESTGQALRESMDQAATERSSR